MTYECRKCGSHKVYAAPQNNRMGVYCADCNEWICWTTYAKMKEILADLKKEDLNDSVSLRHIKRYGRNTTMRCSKCDCLLYDSSDVVPRIQFNLVHAKYCPFCGRKLL